MLHWITENIFQFVCQMLISHSTLALFPGYGDAYCERSSPYVCRSVSSLWMSVHQLGPCMSALVPVASFHSSWRQKWSYRMYDSICLLLFIVGFIHCNFHHCMLLTSKTLCLFTIKHIAVSAIEDDLAYTVSQWLFVLLTFDAQFFAL